MASVFFMTPEVEADARRVRAHAEKPENIYRPGRMPPPGDNPAFVMMNGTYKIVFSLTQTPNGVIRHLSVSTSAKGRLPLPVAVWTVAHLLGFTGASPDERQVVSEPGPTWGCYVEDDAPCVVVQQPYLSQ